MPWTLDSVSLDFNIFKIIKSYIMYLVSKKRSLILKCKTETRGWWCGDSRCGGSGFRPQYFSVLVLLAPLGLLILPIDLVAVVVVVNIKSGFRQQYFSVLVLLALLGLRIVLLDLVAAVVVNIKSGFRQHCNILVILQHLGVHNATSSNSVVSSSGSTLIVLQCPQYSSIRFQPTAFDFCFTKIVVIRSNDFGPVYIRVNSQCNIPNSTE